MIEKIENPLNLKIDAVDLLIEQLQKQFEDSSMNIPEGFSLNESGVSIEIQMVSGTYSYSLDLLKKLKAELEDPSMQSLKEVT
jgi:hypothetical protein